MDENKPADKSNVSIGSVILDAVDSINTYYLGALEYFQASRTEAG
jgi:hypothetical protein